MAASLDTDGMVVALTDGIGAKFGAATRKSFRLQLERLLRHESFYASTVDQQQFIVDALALACFYQNAITPLQASANFINILRTAGATHLRVAGAKLDYWHANKAQQVADSFYALLNRSEIPEPLLRYTTLEDFVSSIKQFVEEERL